MMIDPTVSTEQYMHSTRVTLSCARKHAVYKMHGQIAFVTYVGIVSICSPANSICKAMVDQSSMPINIDQ